MPNSRRALTCGCLSKGSHTHTHTWHTHTQILPHSYRITHRHADTQAQTCTGTHTHTEAQAHIDTHRHVSRHTWTQTHRHARTHERSWHTLTHKHVHIHTHAHRPMFTTCTSMQIPLLGPSILQSWQASMLSPDRHLLSCSHYRRLSCTLQPLGRHCQHGGCGFPGRPRRRDLGA